MIQQESILLGGGCFWCLEPVFKNLRGVERAEPGYAGGKTENPDYHQVCSGETGHAEVVKVTFDPKEISLAQLLEVFFTVHDPTQLNRQGDDVGTQHRSCIFGNKAQLEAARKVLQRLEKEGFWDVQPVTLFEPEKVFYPAEEYHRDYFIQHLDQAYCKAVINPKIAKMRQRFKALQKQTLD